MCAISRSHDLHAQSTNFASTADSSLFIYPPIIYKSKVHIYKSSAVFYKHKVWVYEQKVCVYKSTALFINPEFIFINVCLSL